VTKAFDMAKRARSATFSGITHSNAMTKYIKIFLLFVFVSAPVLDTAFLDTQEPSSHLTTTVQTVDYSAQNTGTDIHSFCHVMHHGVAIDKVPSQGFADSRFKAGPFADLTAHGLHHKPGLQPPSLQLS
jgi:hypothetical protein